MQSKEWPSVYRGEEKPIPIPSSSHSEDILVELRFRTREAIRFFEKIILDHPHFCMEGESAGSASVPELMIVEAGYDHHPTFSFIESITQQDGAPDIFLTSEVSDASLAEKAFQIGVKEFFPIPLDSKVITAVLDRYAIEKGKKDKKRRHRARNVISFLGGRGGIGTTTAVVNLGIALQQMKEAPSVVLLELNSQAGDIDLLLNTISSHTLRELGNPISQIDKITLNQFLVKHDSGLQSLSSGNTDFQIKKLTSEWIDPIITALRAQFDFILIDCGHALDTTTTAALAYSSRIIVLSTLTIPVLRRTKLVFEFLKRGGIPAEKIEWMLNRYIKDESSMLKEAEKICGHSATWMIPNDFPRVNHAMNSGCPLMLEAPRSAIAKKFLHMASALLSNPDLVTSEDSKMKQWVNRIWSKS